MLAFSFFAKNHAFWRPPVWLAALGPFPRLISALYVRQAVRCGRRERSATSPQWKTSASASSYAYAYAYASANVTMLKA